jgi:SAM-dependent methyltransferase
MRLSLKDKAKELIFLLATWPGERKRAHCNVCDSKNVIFCSNQWVRAGVCARCRSESRHRILAAALQNCDDLSYFNLLFKKNVLHIAPEAALQAYLSAATRQYIAADLFPSRKEQKRVDLSDMRDFADCSIDAIIAMDVFEHVLDDGAALRESRRVLSDGGYLIISVPLPDHFPRTDEDKTIATNADRTKFYGQHDHVRIYGEDIGERIRQFGFMAATIDAKSFPAEIRAKHNLAPEGVLHPLATNNRRVIFARKQASNG